MDERFEVGVTVTLLPDGTGTWAADNGATGVIPEDTMREIVGMGVIDAIKEPVKHRLGNGRLIVTAVDHGRGVVTVNVK